MKFKVFFMGCLFLCLGVGNLSVSGAWAQTELLESSTALFDKANTVYNQRKNIEDSKEALQLYETFIEQQPKHVEAHWRASKCAWWVGEHQQDKKIKSSYFQKGIDFAKKAIELDPNSAQAHYWLSGNYGSFGETKGIMKSLKLLKPMRQELDEVTRINPDFEEGGVYRVRGVMDYKVPGLAGGNKKRAGVQLLKAYSYNKKNPFHLYYLSEYYKVSKKYQKSKELLLVLKNLTEKDLTPVADQADLKLMQEKGKILLQAVQKSSGDSRLNYN